MSLGGGGGTRLARRRREQTASAGAEPTTGTLQRSNPCQCHRPSRGRASILPSKWPPPSRTSPCRAAGMPWGPPPGTPAAGAPRPVPAGLGCAERAAEPGEAAAGERAAVRGIRGCGGARSRSERRRERGSPGLEPAAPRRGLSAADQSERSGLCCAGAPLPHFQHARHFATFKGSERPLGVAALRRACGEM